MYDPKLIGTINMFLVWQIGQVTSSLAHVMKNGLGVEAHECASITATELSACTRGGQTSAVNKTNDRIETDSRANQ